VNSFDTYIELASSDDRPVLVGGVASDVQVGINSIGVSVDIVILDPGGYCARHVLWDVPPLTLDDAQLQSAPIVAALQSELGEDRVVGVEVWHLRSGDTLFVASGDAVARLPEVEVIVDGYLSA
jgi:hypothetical protein